MNFCKLPFFFFSLNTFNAKAYGETISTHGLVRQSSRIRQQEHVMMFLMSNYCAAIIHTFSNDIMHHAPWWMTTVWHSYGGGS